MINFIFAVIFVCSSTAFAANETLLTFKLPITNSLKELLGYTKGSYLNYTEWTSSFGYHSEQHSVTTDDGYILTLFRTSSPNCTQLKTYPALLVHGIFSNSGTFLDGGVNTSLVYLLANECYDVWAVNLRGSDYSRAHVTLDPDTDAAFWRYSADEIGYYDLPATIDYILNNTKTAKLNAIGYSLGGESSLIMCADRPSYNDKINLFVGIAPPTRSIHMRTITFRTLLRLANTYSAVFQLLGIEEFFYKGGVLQVALEYICQYAVGLSPQLLGLLDGYNPGSVGNLTSQSIFSNYLIGSSSIQQMAKSGQDTLNEIFSHYSYGAAGNLAKYGSETAPAYNLTNVVAPTLLITGLGDPAVPTEDVHWLGDQLPNTLAVVELSDPLWTHLDNIYSQNIPTVLYPPIKKYLDLYNP